jgi:hypothetical protein
MLPLLFLLALVTAGEPVIQLELSRQTVSATEEIQLTVTVLNKGEESLTVPDPTSVPYPEGVQADPLSWSVHFEIRKRGETEALGRLVRFDEYAALHMPPTADDFETLKPGEQLVISGWLGPRHSGAVSQWYLLEADDMTLESPWTRLKPGEYEIRAGYTNREDTIHKGLTPIGPSEAWEGRVYSNWQSFKFDG